MLKNINLKVNLDEMKISSITDSLVLQLLRIKSMKVKD